MKIAMMGSGGLGGYLGGCLAQAGQDVTFVARGRQLEAIRRNGLRVRSHQGEFQIKPVQATDHPAEVGAVDLILFCVKTYDLLPAAEQMKPMVGAQTTIIPVLNGIDHLETLSQIVGSEHVLGGLSSMTAHVVEPGVVERVGKHGNLEFGEVQDGISARCAAIEQVLGSEGIQGKAVPNIMASMWQKFAAICGMGVFSVVRGDAETLRQAPEAVDLVLAAIKEGVDVAAARGVCLDPALLNYVKAFLNGLPGSFKPSMLVDLEHGRRLEVEALNGVLSRTGREAGIPTPVNDFIYACLKPYANGANGHSG
jgi:2-dehydropantoate 2-reductase